MSIGPNTKLRAERSSSVAVPTSESLLMSGRFGFFTVLRLTTVVVDPI
jgi:hypothetical protein